MGLPTSPVTLTVEQVDELNKKLSQVRHSINNQLALIAAATELIKANPDVLARMIKTISEQPPKISEEIKSFSALFEQVMGIDRP